MYIDPQSKIAGRPALEIRHLLRLARFREFDIEWAADQLRTSQHGARTILDDLACIGYLELVPSLDHAQPLYRRTLAGAALALASAAKPLRRRVAERKLGEFLDRVRLVDENNYYLYRVLRVVVFGSYLGDRECINDVDVAVELGPKESDHAAHMKLKDARIRLAIHGGRRFSNFSHERSWPHDEVLLFLKSRSRAIELHTTDEAILEHVPQQLVYEYSEHTGATTRVLPPETRQPRSSPRLSASQP